MQNCIDEIGSVILRLLIGIVVSTLMPPVPPEGFLCENPIFWPVVLLLMAADIMYGILWDFC